ncbi:MAG: hypothetical protein JSV03_11295 [Planctomycetota bacterium]|nr:MAG: hypothetical protein JSV03_11295 [Planctomycetota bacterium]
MKSKKNTIRLSMLFVCCAMLVINAGCPIIIIPPDRIELTAEADRRAKLLDPNAIVFEITGVNGSYLGSSQTLSYTFLAGDPNNTSSLWELTYNLSSWTVRQYNQPLIGIEYYDMTQVTMSESQVKHILTNVGFNDDFLGWSLYKSLHPNAPDPLYTFNYGNKTATINTRTELLTCSTIPQSTPITVPPGGNNVSLEQIAAADAKIKETASEAFIIWAGGRNSSGQSLNTVTETNLWNFIGILNSTIVTAWWLTCDGTTWTVEQMTSPPFGREFRPLTAVTLDVVQAWDRVVAAGFHPPFQWWSVFKSLHPSVVNPHYVFPIPGGYALMDTITGEVSQE